MKSKPASSNPNKAFDKRAVSVLFMVMVFSRLILYWTGLRFDDSLLDWCWQCIDESLIKDNLLESLWYMHGQPPIFNLVIGLVYKFSPGRFGLIFSTVFKLITLFSSIYIYRILVLINIRPLYSLLVAVLFLLLPFTIIYENWLFYNYPACLILLAIGYYFIVGIKNNNFNKINFSLAWTAFLCLYLSMYHLLFFICIFSLCMWSLGFSKKLVLYGLIFIAPIVFWYGKNYVYFGHFAGSTWLGMSLEKFIWPHRSAIGNIDIFGPIKKYKHLLKEDNRFPNVKLLHMDEKVNGGRNLFHIQYLQVSASSMKDFKDFFRENPIAYLEISSWGFFIFFNPASSYIFVYKPYYKIKYYADIVNLDFMSLFSSGNYHGSKKQSLVLLIPFLLSSILILYGIRKNSREFNYLAVFIFFNVVYLVSVSTFFELGENNRYRIMINPLLLIYFFMGFSLLLKSRALNQNNALLPMD